jgi:hypothetical protein
MSILGYRSDEEYAQRQWFSVSHVLKLSLDEVLPVSQHLPRFWSMIYDFEEDEHHWEVGSGNREASLQHDVQFAAE